MKALLFLLIASAAAAQAALIATVATDRGSVVVELQHAKAPQAVANFITLAQGTRSRIDPATGAVTAAPLYVGEKFFRVLDSTSFKIAQTGSGTGTNGGGPGFTFRDEFDESLTHVPYVLSMANSGPNSNGSQIFFTGNVAIPGLDNVHTVFGIATDPASRAVIDSILAAGNDGTTITGITFERTDPAAAAFDEFAQDLPEVVQPAGSLTVLPGVATTWTLDAPAGSGSIFRAFRSATLSGDWAELDSSRRHVSEVSGDVSIGEMPLDQASTPAAFYHLSLARHSGALAPSDLAGRTVHFTIADDTFDYEFNAEGTGGMLTFEDPPDSPVEIPFDVLSFSSGAHDLRFVADHGNNGVLTRYFQVAVGFDAIDGAVLRGRHSTSYFNSTLGWQPAGRDAATITR